MSDLMDAIKEISNGVSESSNPMKIEQGKVIQLSPLLVYIDQKKTIPEQALVLTESVKSYKTEISISGFTDSNGDTFSGTITATINNNLVIGDSVLLLRMQGGQKYMIIGRGNLS